MAATALKHGQRVRLPHGAIARVVSANGNGTYTVAQPEAPDLNCSYPATYQRHELKPVAPPARFTPGYCGNPQCHKPMPQRADRPPILCPDCEAADGQEPPAIGQKLDGEKPRFDLLIAGMPRALEEVTKVLTFGSQKYADHNWQHVENAEQRYLAASLRHELALHRGETLDPETGLHHLAHKLCCDLFRLELAIRNASTN